MLPTRTLEGIAFPDFDRIALKDWPGLLQQALDLAAARTKTLVEQTSAPDFGNTFGALEVRMSELHAQTMLFSSWPMPTPRMN